MIGDATWAGLVAIECAVCDVDDSIQQQQAGSIRLTPRIELQTSDVRSGRLNPHWAVRSFTAISNIERVVVNKVTGRSYTLLVKLAGN